MVVSAEARQRVYLCSRAIFSGDNANIKSAKRVKELVDQNRQSLGNILTELGEPVYTILQSLLDKKVFESELRAKLEFPELFRSSASRNAERQASEDEAANSTADRLNEIAAYEGEKCRDKGKGIDYGALDDEGSSCTSVLSPTLEMEGRTPNLYPSYIPFETQHLVLNTVQRILEQCCFDFASTSMPSILQTKKWTCAAAGELSEWAKLLHKDMNQQHPAAPDFKGGPLLRDMFILRNTAVHRVPMPARGINDLLKSAVTFAQAMQTSLQASQLEQLQSDLASKIKVMELNKNSLEDSATIKLQAIQREREELDVKEAKLREDIIKDDFDNSQLIGRLIEEAVQGMFTVHLGADKEDVCDSDDGGGEASTSQADRLTLEGGVTNHEEGDGVVLDVSE
ncbi:hypothetical protein CC79DRAFT_1394339 [Sarocladium strictum]